MQLPSRPIVAHNDGTFIAELDKLKKLLQETNDDMKAHASRGCGEPESTGSANIAGGNNDEINLLEDVLLEASHIARITKEKKNVDEKVAVEDLMKTLRQVVADNRQNTVISLHKINEDVTERGRRHHTELMSVIQHTRSSRPEKK